MNATYLAVSIPLLLVMAGFNHAHGLTTFGKSTGNQPTAHPPPPTMRRCHNQTECYAIKGTTCIACQEIKSSSCVGNYCFCGDNRHPTNGKCRDTVNRGPNHVCSRTEDCVFGAECTKNHTNRLAPSERTCQCTEGYMEIGAHCSGGGGIGVFSGLMAILMVLMGTLQ